MSIFSISLNCTNGTKSCNASHYIESSKMLRYKNVTLNPKNIDRCFQYAFTLTKHHEEIKNHPKRVSNIRQFLDLYN